MTSLTFNETYINIAHIENITGSLNGLTISEAGSSYGDYLYWNGSGAYISGSTEIKIGSNSGQIEQGIGSIAIGYQAGQNNQGTGGGYAIAVGYFAGSDNQGLSAISIGIESGLQNQQDNCISIGTNAGQIDQGITADPVKGQAIAVGYKAAQFQQGDKSISIGDHSGQNQQHDLSIAIGSYAGNYQQSTGSIAIGSNSGKIEQGIGSIAIGQNAGYTTLGEYSIAIGNNASQNTGVASSIVLNAQNTALDATQSGFYVNPVRTFDGTDSSFLTYSNNEITQDNNFTYIQSQTGYVINGNLNPYSGAYWNLGDIDKPWKSIYVSTGSVFIGPTGSLQINSNGLIASDVGFAGPIVQVGSTNPGNGIVLYNNNNVLFYQNQSGSTGPVSIFQIASNGGLNIFYTGGNVGFGTNRPTSTVDIHGIANITDKLVIGNNNTGSISFEKNNQTGCFIEALRYNGTGNHYVYYNSSTNELVQASPLYFYAYNTGTITFTGTNTFFPVKFDTNSVIYHDWHHTPGSSQFTGTFKTNG